MGMFTSGSKDKDKKNLDSAAKDSKNSGSTHSSPRRDPLKESDPNDDLS